MQPISNRFISCKSSDEAPRFPLQLRLCPDTGLIHLGKPFPVDELKPRHDWLTCFEPETHLDRLVETILRLPNITPESVFAAYSFKDDSTLERLKKQGYSQTWRIDPYRDLSLSDPRTNVETYQSVFTPKIAEEIRERYGGADVFIVRHVVEHAYNLLNFIQAIRLLIKPEGYIVWELPDCEKALSLGDCTTIWEEHIFYFTRFTFQQLLLASGFNIVHYESVPYALENSLIAIVQESPDRIITHQNPDSEALAKECDRARHFAQNFLHRREIIKETLAKVRREREKIALFGAGHLAVAFLSLMEVTDLIDFVIDDNPHKKGMKMPLGNLEIVGSDVLYRGDIRLCLLGLNPQNQPKVIAKHQRFLDEGGIFASIFPGSDRALENVL
ncbi:MAG: methyltransferase domain-containing protein [Spirulina sp.]